jgi:hypothetical protein
MRSLGAGLPGRRQLFQIKVLRLRAPVAQGLVERMGIRPRYVGTDKDLLHSVASRPLLGCRDKCFADAETTRIPVDDQPDDLNLGTRFEKKTFFNGEPAEQAAVFFTATNTQCSGRSSSSASWVEISGALAG